MSRTRHETVQIRELAQLPVTATLLLRRHAKTVAEDLRAGRRAGVLPAVVARAAGRLYPVDNLDTVEAYRMAGLEEVPCHLVECESVVEAQQLHIDASMERPANPFLVSDALDWVKQHGGQATGLAATRYNYLAKLKISVPVRREISEYLAEMSSEGDHVPDLWHALQPISQAPEDSQPEMFKRITSYYRITRSVPDAAALKNFLRQYDSRDGGGGDTVTIEGGGGGADAGGDNSAGRGGGGADAGGRISSVETGKKAAGNISEVSGNHVYVECECGAERYVNKKNGAVRRISDGSPPGVIMLEGDDGADVFTLPRDLVTYLDLDSGQPVHLAALARMRRRPGADGPRGVAVLLSRRRIPPKTAKQISELLEAGWGEPAGGPKPRGARPGTRRPAMPGGRGGPARTGTGSRARAARRGGGGGRK